MAVTNSDNSESLLCAESAGVAPPAAPERPISKERLGGACVAKSPLRLAADTCDLALPSLLLGIHGNSAAQEAPIEETLEPSSERVMLMVMTPAIIAKEERMIDR
jgi:hypothetical protein